MDGQTLYAFRVAHQDVLRREADRRVSLECVRDGSLVEPTAGTFALLDPGGAEVVSGPVVMVTSVATYDILAANLPDSLPYSELYQERWSLSMPDGTTRIVRRECAVAPFLLHLPVADQDLLAEYPDLLSQLGEAGTTLQPFIDEAWRKTLERLWSVGRWPDLMLSSSAFRGPVVERALFLVFKYLYRQVSGGSRWEKLMDYHREEAEAAWSRMSSRIDKDLDGLPDSTARAAVGGTIQHRNASPHQRLRRSRWW